MAWPQFGGRNISLSNFGGLRVLREESTIFLGIVTAEPPTKSVALLKKVTARLILNATFQALPCNRRSAVNADRASTLSKPIPIARIY
jgi:hypothetical protein